MKQVKVKRAGGSPKNTAQPLEEGIQKRSKQRSWRNMTDAELISYAKKFMEEKGISGRMELKNSDEGLYAVLKRRGLFDKINFEEKQRKGRSWKKMKDEQLIKYAIKFMKDKGINGKTELKKADPGLYGVLRTRKLLDKIDVEDKHRDWALMTDEEVIEYARNLMRRNRINIRSGLENADSGVYAVLRIRKLLDRVGFEEKKRFWKNMKDEGLIRYARQVLNEKGIKKRKELHTAYPGLYNALRIRGLLGSVGFEKKQRDWASMSKEELVAFANGIVETNDFKNRSELKKSHHGLFNALQRKKLLGRLKLKPSQRKWIRMSDQEMLDYAKNYVREHKIRNRKGLEMKFAGLYVALNKRNLLDSVGLEKTGRQWAEMKDSEFLAFAGKFIEKNNILTRKELELLDSGLYQTLIHRGLMDSLKFQKGRIKWSRMSEEQIIDLALKEISEKGIQNRTDFYRANKALYCALARRSLLDSVFAEMEATKEEATRKQLRAGLAQAAEAMEKFGERR